MTPWSLECPERFSLDQNTPNPFNPSTTIRFNTTKHSDVSFTIHDLTGVKVATLVNHALSAGYHEVRWDSRDALGRRVGSGVYFARLTTAEGTLVRRMTLVR